MYDCVGVVRRLNFGLYFSGMRGCASRSVQKVAFDLNRNLLYVAFNEFFMFNFVAGLSYFTRLVVNLARV